MGNYSTKFLYYTINLSKIMEGGHFVLSLSYA